MKWDGKSGEGIDGIRRLGLSTKSATGQLEVIEIHLKSARYVNFHTRSMVSGTMKLHFPIERF